MEKRLSALAYRRQEAYRRLAEIDAYQLWQSGCVIELIAARADTTRVYVRQWLKEAAAPDTAPADPTPQTSADDHPQASA
jgi:hypothetical protein